MSPICFRLGKQANSDRISFFAKISRPLFTTEILKLDVLNPVNWVRVLPNVCIRLNDLVI